MNCSECGAPLEPGDKFCANCAHPVATWASAPSTIAPSASPTHLSIPTQPPAYPPAVPTGAQTLGTPKYCNHCGQPNLAHAIYCSTCGQLVSATSHPPAYPPVTQAGYPPAYNPYTPDPNPPVTHVHVTQQNTTVQSNSNTNNDNCAAGCGSCLGILLVLWFLGWIISLF